MDHVISWVGISLGGFFAYHEIVRRGGDSSPLANGSPALSLALFLTRRALAPPANAPVGDGGTSLRDQVGRLDSPVSAATARRVATALRRWTKSRPYLC